MAAEVRRQFRVKSVIMPIALGDLGTIPANTWGSLEELEIENVIGKLQTVVLISNTATLRRVLNL